MLFAAVNYLSGPRSLLQWVKKAIVCDLWISIHFACFCVSRFVACDFNNIMIDGREKRDWEGGF